MYFPMVDLHRSLACRENPNEVIAQAQFVLTEARAIAEQADQALADLAAQPPLEWGTSQWAQRAAVGLKELSNQGHSPFRYVANRN